MGRQISRRAFLRNAGVVAAGLGAVSASARHGVADAKQTKRWRTAVGLNGFSSSRRSYGYDKWIMLDLWDIPDIYRATIVGKEKLDAMQDILFSV